MRQRKPVLFTIVVLLAVCFVVPFLAAGDKTKTEPPAPSKLSHVRVVRLSFIQGTVTMRVPGSDAWTNVTVNAPLQEGFAIATTMHSFAEVQFENGSTLRLGEVSSLEFTQLALTPQGGHINRLTLDDGYATLNVLPEKHDQYALIASRVTLTPQGRTEFRADLNPDMLHVEVFDGRLEAVNAAQTEKLTKNRVLAYDVAEDGSFQVTDKFQKDEWDKWTEARDRQSTLAYDDAPIDPGAGLYGWEDLVAYGDWAYFPGFGYGWAPYEPLGWSPYGLGSWGFYPGLGYTWISGEPWGWLPFHYGFWNFSPQFGWFWMPGSFGAWSPALVNWYSGPGWIGWAPIGPAGAGGAAPCTLGISGCLTAVPRAVVGGGYPIRPGGPCLVNVTSTVGVTSIAEPDVAPVRTPVASAGFVTPSAELTARGGAASGFVRGPDAAPSSVVMGREVVPDAFLKTAFRDTATPIHARLGAMLGGRFAADAKGFAGAGAPQALAHGGASSGFAGSSRGGPQILSRADRVGGFDSGGSFGGRGGGASGGGFGAAHAGGGGGGGGHAGGGGGHR